MISKKVRGFAQLLLLTILLYFVGKTIIFQMGNIHWATLKLNYKFLVFAIISDLLTRIFTGILYSSLLSRLNSYLPYPITMAISWLSVLGKYIPGKMAVLGSTMFLLARYKVRPEITAIVPILANGMIIILCLFLSLPLLFSEHGSQLFPVNRIWFFPFLLVGIIAVHPQFFFGLTNWLLRSFKRPALHIKLTFKQMLIPFSVVLAQCIFSGITTWCVMHSVTFVSVHQIPLLISISVLAGTFGFLAFFSPAGIGVREGVYLLMLSPLIGPEMAVLSALVLRLLQTAADIIMSVVGLGILRFFKMHKEIKNV